MNEQEQTGAGQTRQAPRESIIATRATMHEAKRHFEAGGAVLVSEYGHEPTQTVTASTTTHDRTSTTWDALAADVKEWRNRYPNQRFYIVPTVDACTCSTDEDDIGQEQEQEQEQAAPTMADAATDPMADQTTWTTHGVSDAERATIVAAAAMIGRTFRYRGGGEFSVLGVNDCRPAHNGASVYGTYRYVRSDGRADDTYNGSTWVADLGAEVAR